MPTYGYRCDACEVSYDVTKPMAEYDSPEECPNCQGDARKLFEATGFVLKGDDWAGKGVVGAEFVESIGGRVVLLSLVEGLSTSRIIEKIRAGG